MKALLLLLGMSTLICCQNSNLKEAAMTSSENEYCKKIDSLVYERYTLKSGNYFANSIIPFLEKESNISASCQKGYYGYLYSNDSTFNSDMTKWGEYFKCK